jgi:site-specific DNA recombinase
MTRQGSHGAVGAQVRAAPDGPSGPGKVLRCAVYARVSTEHGLDMAFTSLDAQREACAAYILSQKHEGWTGLPTAYEDGGFSGGSLERPDLKRLMDDVRARKLDIVVVYKVDRLTRSLADFARLVELFDAHGVSFVSVTQAFNTTTSMGRLTLNVLLSFAQFEREVTGERIRDKIAASKRKGIRMGGPVPLGYGLSDKRLVIDEVEASSVRAIFSGYLEQGSLTALLRHLAEQGVMTKRTHRRDGSVRGGVQFGKGALAYLLRNRVYIGEIRHKGHWYRSDHPPIIAAEVFAAVQEGLDRAGEGRRQRRARLPVVFPLAGRLVDDRGNAMTPTRARKNGAHYRYYVSSALAQGRHPEAGSIARVSALAVEDAVLNGLRSASVERGEAAGNAADLLAATDRVIVHRDRLEVRVRAADGGSLETLTIPWTPPSQFRYRARIDAIHSHGLDGSITPASSHTTRPIRAETRARLLLGIARARRWLDDLTRGRVADLRTIAEREGCSERTVRQTLALAFLPRTTIRSVIDGTISDRAGIASFTS